MSFRCKKVKIFHELYPAPSRLCYESVAELTTPWDPHPHFITFRNSILIQKMDINRNAWINPWLPFDEKVTSLSKNPHLQHWKWVTAPRPDKTIFDIQNMVLAFGWITDNFNIASTCFHPAIGIGYRPCIISFPQK